MKKNIVENADAVMESTPLEVNQEDNIPEEPKKKEKPHKVWKRKYIHEVNKDNDIKFRGPLSYRHLRICGWLFLALAQIGALLSFGQTIYQDPTLFGNAPSVLSFFSSLMAPLFLIAAFSVVLNAKNGYKRLITLYAGVSILLFLVFLLIYEYYIVGTFSIALGWDKANISIATLTIAIAPNGFIAFNIFIDLLLCTLVTFFINYRPKKYFQNKKMYIFRLFALLPILYELGSIVLKMLATGHIIALHPLVFPLLTTKPPVAFFIFVFMALFVKNRERYYVKKGKTHEEYVEFLDTNVNSFHFALSLSGTVIVAAIVDAIIFVIMIAVALTAKIPLQVLPTTETEEIVQALSKSANEVLSWGIGKTVVMVLIVPLLLLFDYKKSYKNPMIDTVIPIAGIIVIVLIFFEGGYEVLKQYLINLIKASEESKQEPVEKAIQVVKYIKDIIAKK